MAYRVESDSVGEKEVSNDAYYGVQTLRAYENFNITGSKLPTSLIISLAEIKKACAITNMQAGDLDNSIASAIIFACDEIINGKFHGEFILDQIQGGAGTSTNMNANEVIANIALEKLGKEKGCYGFCHPNDHVNMGQSTNDVYPSSLKLSIYRSLLILVEKLDRLHDALMVKAEEFKDVIKMGRTQLMDAIPITLGQEFKAYASAIARSKRVILSASNEMLFLNLAGTAIGTGLNTSEYFYRNVVPELSKISNLPLIQVEDMIDGTQHIDSFSIVSSSLKVCAISLSKMANDIRLMNSGPRTGLGEIIIPAKQNGSSIMPGKINPVIPETVSQCAFAVIGNDVAVTMACEAGQLELNAFEPLVFNRIHESITMLGNVIDTFVDNCIVDIVANADRCKELLYNSAAFATALCPTMGYGKCADIAKSFLNDGVPIVESALNLGLSQEELDELLMPQKLTRQFEQPLDDNVSNHNFSSRVAL